MPRIAVPGTLRASSWQVVSDAESLASQNEADASHAAWLRLGWRPSYKPPSAPHPIQDASSGRFVARDRYAGNAPKRGLLGGDYTTPYYIRLPIKLVDSLLPCLRQARELKCAKTLAWDPLSPDIQLSIRDLLDQIGGVLYRGALLEPCITDPDEAGPSNRPVGTETVRVMLGSDAFARPLVCSNVATETDRDPTDTDPCMWADPALVKAHACMHLGKSKGAYLRVSIGDIPEGGQRLVEYAHRIVGWAMFGPAPKQLTSGVLMHTCGQPTCLNPRHLVWGERSMNSSPLVAYRHSEHKLTVQHRPITPKLKKNISRETKRTVRRLFV